MAELGEYGELEFETEVPGLEGEGTGGGGGGGRDRALVAFAAGVLGEVAVVFDGRGVEGSEEAGHKGGHFDGGGESGEEEEGDVRAEVGGALEVGQALVDAWGGENGFLRQQDDDEFRTVSGGPYVVRADGGDQASTQVG